MFSWKIISSNDFSKDSNLHELYFHKLGFYFAVEVKAVGITFKGGTALRGTAVINPV